MSKQWLKVVAVALLGAGFMLSTSAAQAQQDGLEKGVPIWKHSLKWWEKHTYWRLGGAELVYFGSSSAVSLTPSADAYSKASLALPIGPIPGSGAGVSSHEHFASGVLGFILPMWGGHVSTEVLLAAPLKLQFQTRGVLENQPVTKEAIGGQPGDPLDPGVPVIGRKVGYIHALPPNFTLVYRPFLHSIIRPYIGVGAYWLYSYSFNITSPALHNSKVHEAQLTLTRPVGCIGQAGFDIKLPWGLYFTADAKYLGCATIHAKLHHVEVYSPTLSPGFGPIKVGTLSVDDHMRAWVFSLTLGSTFWGG